MLAPWSKNPEWLKGLKRGDTCTRVSDRFTPCGRPLPCPVHDRPRGENPDVNGSLTSET